MLENFESSCHLLLPV